MKNKIFFLTRNRQNIISTSNTLVIIYACLLPLKIYFHLTGEIIKMLLCLTMQFPKISSFPLIFKN